MGRAYAGAWASREAGADALASAARMRGRSSWQVTQLAASRDAEGAAERVLERVSAAAGRSGAERVFLRLPSECDLLDAARRAGYFPAYYETLMVSRRLDSAPSRGPRWDTAPREASQQDEYDQFRVYNAAVPSQVRRLAGVTFDQWRDSRERGSGRAREYVLEGERGLAGWVSAGRTGANGWLRAMAAPEAGDASATLAAFGMERMVGARWVRALVPEFQPDLLRVLRDVGFEPGPEYVVCIRTTALAVRLTRGAEAPA